MSTEFSLFVCKAYSYELSVGTKILGAGFYSAEVLVLTQSRQSQQLCFQIPGPLLTFKLNSCPFVFHIIDVVLSN